MDLRVDLLIEQRLRRKPGRPWLHVLRGLTELGGGVLVTAVTTATAIALFRRGRRRDAVATVCTIALGSAARYGLHRAVARPRPSRPHIHVTGAAFPSGHTTAAVLLYGTLARLAGGGWAWLPALALAGSVGASRVLLRAHWLSDVVAAFAFAAGWMTGVELAFRSVAGNVAASEPGRQLSPAAT